MGDDTNRGQAVEHQLDGYSGDKKAEDFFSDEHTIFVQLGADSVGPPENDNIEEEDEAQNGQPPPRER